MLPQCACSTIHLCDPSLLRLVQVELLSPQGPHDSVEDAELERSQCPDHDAPCSKALCAKLGYTCFLGDVHHALWDGTVTPSTRLVHLGQERVSGVRDDGRGNTC